MRGRIASRHVAFAIAVGALALGPHGTAGQTSSSVSASCRVLQDTLIRQKTPTASYDSYPKGWAHSAVEGTAGSWIEALLRFDLSACLPAGAQVSSAGLRLHVTNASPHQFEIYELPRPFSAAATWNVYASGLAWTTPGAMGAGTDYGRRVATVGATSAGAVKVPLSASVVQQWVGSRSRSIVVRPMGSPGTNNAPVGLGFRSKEHPDGSPPVLNVVYSLPSTTDTTAPVISNVNVTPGTTSATIRWSTNEPADGRVAYGPTTSYGAATALSSSGLTVHSHKLTNLTPNQRYYYRLTSRDAAGNARTATGDFFTVTDSGGSSTFKIVAWNLHYGKGMTAKADGMTCPLPGLKDNPQCQIPDDPNTLINEREEERRRSAWGIGLTQRYLNGPMVLGDQEVIALLLTEVNSGTCFSQQDLMAVVRRVWPRAVISRTHRDNWMVARWGFVHGVTNYGEKDIPPCGLNGYTGDGLRAWPASYAEGIAWGRIYAEDPDPDGDGMLKANPRTLNVFNAHWPPTGFNPDGTPFFCRTSATITRDFMNAPVAGVNLASEPIVLGGDLNFEDVVRPYETSHCEPYGAREGYDLFRAAGFADAFTAGSASRVTPTADGSTGMIGRPATETCYRKYSHNGLYMPYKRVDFQWHRSGATTGRRLKVMELELIGAEQFGNCVPSDHLGTKVRYAWY